MLRIRLYSKDPRWKSRGIGNFEGGEPAKIAGSFFDTLFKNNELPPLRDEASIRLLRTFGKWKLMEGEWYGLKHRNGWDSLSFPELSKYDRFTRAVLCLAENSRKGIYTDYSDDAWHWYYDAEEPAKMLNRLPFDILVACDAGILKSFVHAFRRYDGLIENWPFHGKTLQVRMRQGIWQGTDSFFQKIPDENTALRLGQDGVYYVDPFELDISGDFQNFGCKEDEGGGCVNRENIIREAEKLREPEIRLIETEPEETAEDYLRRLCAAVRKYPERIPAGDRHGTLWNCSEEAEPGPDYLPEEMRKFRIISHLPEIPFLRNVVKYAYIIRIRKKESTGCECFVRGCVKFPDFLDLLQEVFNTIKEEADNLEEYLMVVIDREEGSVSEEGSDLNLNRVACGFLLRQDSLEILDARKTRRKLAELLSGKD